MFRHPVFKLRSGLCCACTLAAFLHCATVIGNPAIQLTQTQERDSALQLETRDAPLGQILKTIAAKTGAVIHYSVLPEAPVTATCVGADVGQIMDCLVAKQVGLVAHKPRKDRPAEFWLLGSSVGSCRAMTVDYDRLSTLTRKKPRQRTPEEQARIDQSLQEQSDKMVEQAKSKDIEQRKEAIANLSSVGRKDDPAVQKVLDDAFNDKDPDLRAQAIATMVNLDKENSGEIIVRALRDSDTTVRMAAVDNIYGNRELLEQALSDANADVRNFAQAKLNNLEKNAKK